MTRKDFCLLAAALNATHPGKTSAPTYLLQHRDCCRSVANALATTNPRFDRARFLAACGVEQQS